MEQGLMKVNVLMIEDNGTDAFLTAETLSESTRARYDTAVVPDAFEGLAYLEKHNGYEHATRPDIILLDLNLPMMHGFEFLRRIKKDSRLNSIPVCILSTSNAQEDVEKARQLGAECYLVKPLELENFETDLSRIIERTS
jgi:two-component system, chemotaxis family, response regulator Rcp1